jgi:hypothetical protein
VVQTTDGAAMKFEEKKKPKYFSKNGPARYFSFTGREDCFDADVAAMLPILNEIVTYPWLGEGADMHIGAYGCLGTFNMIGGELRQDTPADDGTLYVELVFEDNEDSVQFKLNYC